MLRTSADNGTHFDAARAIARSKDAAGSPQLLQKDGHAFVAWNTARPLRSSRGSGMLVLFRCAAAVSASSTSTPVAVTVS